MGLAVERKRQRIGLLGLTVERERQRIVCGKSVDRCSEEGVVGSCRGKEEQRIDLLGLVVERELSLRGARRGRARRKVMVEYS